MKHITQVAPLLQEALCFHEMFRRLGFTSDQIFLELGIDDVKFVPTLFVKIECPDGEFRLSLGPCTLSADELRVDYKEATEIFINALEEDLQELWCNSIAYQNAPVIVTAFTKKGIRIPAITTGVNQVISKKHLN